MESDGMESARDGKRWDGKRMGILLPPDAFVYQSGLTDNLVNPPPERFPTA